MVAFSVVTFTVITTGSAALDSIPTRVSTPVTMELQTVAKPRLTKVAEQKTRKLVVKYVALGHNTIRGAAGCAILIAEPMRAQGYL